MPLCTLMWHCSCTHTTAHRVLTTARRQNPPRIDSDRSIRFSKVSQKLPRRSQYRVEYYHGRSVRELICGSEMKELGAGQQQMNIKHVIKVGHVVTQGILYKANNVHASDWPLQQTVQIILECCRIKITVAKS